MLLFSRRALVWCLLLLTPFVEAHSKLGCLFDENLCENNEFCFDDNAFGVCAESVDTVTVHKVPTDRTDDETSDEIPGSYTIKLWEQELKRLLKSGYHWSSEYTQCVIRNLLHTHERGLVYDPGLCSRLLSLTQVTMSPALFFDQQTSGEDRLDEDEAAADDSMLPSFARISFSDSRTADSPKRAPNDFSPPLADDVGDNDPIASLPMDLFTTMDDDGDYAATAWKRQLEKQMKKTMEDADADDQREDENDKEYGDFLDGVASPERSDYDDTAYIRGSRFDIKKPGPRPIFDTETQYDDGEPDQQFQSWDFDGEKEDEPVPSPETRQVGQKEEFIESTSNRIHKKKKEWRAPNFEVVDGSRTWILFEPDLKLSFEPLTSHFISSLEHELHLPRGTFSDVRVEEQMLSFKVNPNDAKLNASSIATKLGDLRSQIQTWTSGLRMKAAGIGDENRLELIGDGAARLDASEAMALEHARGPSSTEQTILVLLLIGGLCVLIAGLILAAYTWMPQLLEHQARFSRRVKSMIGQLWRHKSDMDSERAEAAKDYQDLCRQRMASKSSESTPKQAAKVPSSTGATAGGRSRGASSSSSRSSTSSWSEEPVGTVNMDISTGHMILKYMEEYSKNRERLQREWEALCVYEPEPNAVSIASRPKNKAKNRYNEPIRWPFDHSLVGLGGSTEAYVNASSLTDSDPRNPSYIVTQGPLQSTIADFWTLVWEQGVVNIVMLSRLHESGVEMSAKYWPEEGSAVFGSFEVHLVSEHIWSDDYLVRSLYLKNLMTTETRTVTQFHFLSWPKNGTPPSSKSLLDYRRKVNKSFRNRPILVHCDDGQGRSGAYCAIDMILARVTQKGCKEIDIAAAIEHMRDQRPQMVANQSQFEFILKAVAEEIQTVLQRLTIGNTPSSGGGGGST